MTLNHQFDEEIINIVHSIFSNAEFKVDTPNEAVLVKLFELRGQPLTPEASVRDIEADYFSYVNQAFGGE